MHKMKPLSAIIDLDSEYRKEFRDNKQEGTSADETILPALANYMMQNLPVSTRMQT